MLDKDLWKDTTLKQLLTKLPEIFVLYMLLHFHMCFGSSEEALKFPEIKGQSTENS
jgi:hypothetical protein